MRRAIVLGSSRGIGKQIADSLESLDVQVTRTSTKSLDTSNIDQVDQFIKDNPSTDILVLNTGGPPAKHYENITEHDCNKYHNQLFYSFFKMLQKIHINDGGYIFLVSSHGVLEPNSNLILSNAYRTAFTSALKSVGKELLDRKVSTINIAPGPIYTDRLVSLVDDIDEFAKTLPMGKIGMPNEIGSFVASIVKEDIKCLSGVTIKFDGGLSNYVL
jgi:3-oxoacyl-[acyl-carrier protein] reductase